MNFVCMISGFSCQSSMLTHIYNSAVSDLAKIEPSPSRQMHTFLKVLSPAKMLPPIHVEYFLSGGAKILILISFTANLWTSCNNLSPNPFVNVLPPDKTMFPKRAFRRSRSVRLIASTTIWWMPGYSRPIISGSKRISGARKRSAPIYHFVSMVHSEHWLLGERPGSCSHQGGHSQPLSHLQPSSVPIPSLLAWGLKLRSSLSP